MDVYVIEFNAGDLPASVQTIVALTDIRCYLVTYWKLSEKYSSIPQIKTDLWEITISNNKIPKLVVRLNGQNEVRDNWIGQCLGNVNSKPIYCFGEHKFTTKSGSALSINLDDKSITYRWVH